MAAPASDPMRLVRSASLTVALYSLVIMISSMTMVKPAHAVGTVSTSVTYSGGLSSSSISCNHMDSIDAVQSCTLAGHDHMLAEDVNGFNAGPQFWPKPLSCPTSVLTDNGPSGGYVDVFVVTSYRAAYNSNYYVFCVGPRDMAYAVYTQLSCPINSTPTGSTCTCNGTYEPDSTQTSCVSVNSCPANMSGFPCVCNAGYELDPFETGCALAQYTLSLTTDPLDKVVPSGTANVIATVEKSVGGQTSPKSDVLVNMKVDVEAGSGGHNHDDGRHIPPYTGTLDRATGTTSSEGKVGFTFKAPEISGTHNITVACVNLACSNNPQTIRIDVKVDGLTTLTASPDFVLIGAVENRHTDNHWLTAQAKTNLQKIVNKYNAAYPDGPLLHLNDASLIWGGKFDISGKWTGDHKGHRRGEEIDIRANQLDTAIPESRFKDFQRFANQSGATADLHCNPPYSLAIPGCVLDNGPNRHFHVYLSGK